MKDLCIALAQDVPNIVARWLDYVDREPWSELSVADRLDDLPRFLTTLLTELQPAHRQDRSSGSSWMQQPCMVVSADASDWDTTTSWKSRRS